MLVEIIGTEIDFLIKSLNRVPNKGEKLTIIFEEVTYKLLVTDVEQIIELEGLTLLNVIDIIYVVTVQQL